MICSAALSRDEMYRYSLTRTWDLSLPQVIFIMLNPSTANASEDDATIRKCIGFAKRWGFGSLSVLNLFAIRSRWPDDLFETPIAVFCDSCGHGWSQFDGDHTGPRPCRECGSYSTSEAEAEWDPIGPDYEKYFAERLRVATHVVAAWGCEQVLKKKRHGKSLSHRPVEVMHLVEDLAPLIKVQCLGTSKTGNPYHPLMLAYDTPLRYFTGSGQR